MALGGQESGSSVVVPNWNGRVWLEGCLNSLATQSVPALEVIVVDNGSTDGSVAYVRSEHPGVRVLELDHNTGFAHAANRGFRVARGRFVALVNTDVVLPPDWVAAMSQALIAHPEAGAVACKILALSDPGRVYDAGDVLRRDGACEQRGRLRSDHGQWNQPGEVFGACAAAALYRRAAVMSVDGFDERFFAYLEDVDLALRLALAGWRCRYEPTVAYHAGEGSSRQLAGGHRYLVERNTLLLVAKAFPIRWLPFVAYRQAAWAWHAMRERRLANHMRALIAGLAVVPAALRERGRLKARTRVPIEVVVPRLPIRGPSAGGHPAQVTVA